jgi:integrase
MARPRLERPNYRLVRRGEHYYVRWWEDGRHQRVSTGTADRAEAARYLIRFEAGLASNPPPPRRTIGAILDGYLANRKERVAAYDTLEVACMALRRHLGELEPDDLTREQSRLYAKRRRQEGYEVGPADARRRKPVSDGTIIRELVTLRAALRWAITEKWISQDPYIELPRTPRPRERWLTREEADRLLAGCRTPHVRLYVALALYTAARRGAILGLQWSAVDFQAGVIDLGHGTGTKRRGFVPIAEPLRPLLEGAAKAATCPYVVEWSGAPVADIKTGFRDAMSRAGLSGVSPHTLRHTAATWMAMAGVPMSEIARFLSDSEKTVERVYAKWNPDYLRRAANALGGSTT